MYSIKLYSVVKIKVFCKKEYCLLLIFFFLEGNELAVMQFTPSMLEVDLDLGHNQFLQCLNQDEVVSTVPDINKSSDDQKSFLTDVLKTDQAAASEAAEYFLSSGAAKQKSPRRPKIQKVKTAKRRKLK